MQQFCLVTSFNLQPHTTYTAFVSPTFFTEVTNYSPPRNRYPNSKLSGVQFQQFFQQPTANSKIMISYSSTECQVNKRHILHSCYPMPSSAASKRWNGRIISLTPWQFVVHSLTWNMVEVSWKCRPILVLLLLRASDSSANCQTY